jgi:small-conductance mechanosensitive channel
MDRTRLLINRLDGLPGIQSPVWQKLYIACGIIVGFAIAWYLTKGIMTALHRRLMPYRLFSESPVLFSLLRKTANVLLVGLTLWSLATLTGIPLLEKLVLAATALVLAGPLTGLLNTAMDTLRLRVAVRTENKVDDIVFDLLHRFSGVIIVGTAIVVALDILGINVIPFIAGAGVAGIAIGFAAKDTLSNLIAGVLLIIDRPFEIGDRIEVWSAPRGSASWGDVVDIGLRATKIKTTDNIVVIIPNNEIMKRDIVNYTHLGGRIRVRIDIGVGYDADIGRAKSAVLAVASTLDWVVQDPSPKVVVRHFGESSVDLQLRVWIDDARRRMDTISTITDRVKERFAAEAIEIPYPKRDITVTYKTVAGDGAPSGHPSPTIGPSA